MIVAEERRAAPSNSEMMVSLSWVSGREVINCSKLVPVLVPVIWGAGWCMGRSRACCRWVGGGHGTVTVTWSTLPGPDDGRRDCVASVWGVIEWLSAQLWEYGLPHHTHHTDMKRPRESSSNTPLPSDIADRPAKRLPAKRAKASQACTSCRKHKTRCELLESASYNSRCHRCDVLSITCSFESDALPMKAADNSPMTTVRRRLLDTILCTPQSNSDKCLAPTQSEIPGSTPRSITTSPWEFLKVPGMPDWTATPMLAMLTLSKMACKDQPIIQPMTNLAFTEVLTNDQRQYLLSL